MNKLIPLIFLFLILFGVNINAQDINIDNYQIARNLEPFTGTWIGIYNQDTLTVHFRMGEIYMDLFKKNIPVLEGSHNYTDNTPLEREEIGDRSSITKGLLLRDDKTVTAQFHDLLKKNKLSGLILELDENNADKMEWTIKPLETFKYGSGFEKFNTMKGFSVPKSIILYRVE